jgi:hypothetical protein
MGNFRLKKWDGKYRGKRRRWKGELEIKRLGIEESGNWESAAGIIYLPPGYNRNRQSIKSPEAKIL